ncbi:hypothetical protein EJB05_49701 [Eragrostis curvula]|uniref:F-box domain-containing protein n=1 Tax=Eragrostis curvula TaxID=38414 RepID=A0A5J9T575_9POAL|nr:hypothetical protein EJB05_49701 [Eragrostis curvula]
METVGDLDRISALPVELLHLILAAVGDAVAVTRTAVLSRRWRNVWMQADRLLLVDSEAIRPGRFADFVDWVFAQRGDAELGSLYITHAYGYKAACITQERVNQWLRYAMQCVVKSLDIRVPYVQAKGNIGIRSNDEPAIKMPGHGRMSFVKLRLGYYRLQLPMVATAKYEALTELALYSTTFDEDEEEPSGARTTTLGNFVSTCCPRLRKLEIWCPDGLRQLVLRTEALQKLRLYCADDLETLDVVAPNLRVLQLACCIEGSVVKVSAKRLEEVEVQYLQDVRLELRDLTNIRCLGPIDVYMHGQHLGPDSGSGLWLLENCPSAQHIKLSLRHWEASNVTDDELVDYLTPSQGAPPLKFPNVRSMEVTVQVHRFPEGHLVASMSSLLLRFPDLRSLCINLFPSGLSDVWGCSWRWDCLCSRLDTWLSPQVISLRSLETVKISGFIGADEEIDLVSLLFGSSNSIKSMTACWEWEKIKTSNATTDTPATISLKQMMAEGDNNGIETVAQKLTNIPGADRGLWQFRKDACTWAIKNPTRTQFKQTPKIMRLARVS